MSGWQPGACYTCCSPTESGRFGAQSWSLLFHILVALFNWPSSQETKGNSYFFLGPLQVQHSMSYKGINVGSHLFVKSGCPCLLLVILDILKIQNCWLPLEPPTSWPREILVSERCQQKWQSFLCLPNPKRALPTRIVSPGCFDGYIQTKSLLQSWSLLFTHPSCTFNWLFS